MFSPSNKNKLIGSKVNISLGEPWSLSSGPGDNVLTGIIIDVSNKEDSNEWVLCEVSKFKFNSNWITRIAGVERYKDKVGILKQLKTKKEVISNFLFKCDGSILQPIDIEEAIRRKDRLQFLVGTINIENRAV